MQLIEELVESQLQEKEILIEGILGKGDLVAFGGRRKNGKTTLLFNLAFSLATGKEFMSHKVNRGCKVLLCLLEDSEENCKKKASTLWEKEQPRGKIGIINRGILSRLGIRKVDVEDASFCSYVRKTCQDFQPDVVVLDNLSRMVAGKYNEPDVVDKAVVFAQNLALDFGCSVIVAAHLRKRDREDSTLKLINKREDFFEDLMGSSHLVNSVDCLWGIEIKDKDERTNYFLGGMQRLTGEEHLSLLQLNGEENFELVSDTHSRKLVVVNTEKRNKAWRELGAGPWTSSDAQKLVSSLNKTAFYGWWRELVRQGLVEQVGEDLWVKTEGTN